MRLYGYWRSSATWRVRIALAHKGLAYDTEPVSLIDGAQREEAFAALNPNRSVPVLIDDDGTAFDQSLAIVEYLDERHPEPPLLPGDAAARARIRALAQTIACDIHPLNNLRVLRYLRHDLGHDQDAIDAWQRHWLTRGLGAVDAAAGETAYLAGDTVTLADICLVPQLYNARRVAADLAPFPRLLAIEARLLARPAFADTRPETQPDAPPP